MAGAAPSVKAADYAVCHVEQGFNNAAGPVTEYPNYYTHPVLARAIAKTGFDTCSTASNWTFLKGLEGIGRTNSALAQEAVTSAGARAKRGQDLAVIEEVDGIRVAHLSATDPADSPAVPGAPWAINRATAAEIVEQARGAREAGAEVVVVSLAMGDMGSTTPNDVQRRAVRTIAKSGDVDLVIGHGSHTIQGAEQVDGMWAIWHGNLLSSFFPDQTRMHEGLISHVTLTEQPDGRFSATKARGEIVLSLPQSGRLLTGTPRTCADYPQRWRQAYAATSMAMEAALADGFRLTPPC
jgi:poly-gamma-glutamate synthesis protein (capsule biosynthesis protein)